MVKGSRRAVKEFDLHVVLGVQGIFSSICIFKLALLKNKLKKLTINSSPYMDDFRLILQPENVQLFFKINLQGFLSGRWEKGK
jgi:hypothetical protein